MLRLLFHCAVALLPWWLKNPIYRHWCGYEVGKSVRIGFSPLVVGSCRLGDQTRIGHFNLFWKTRDLIVEKDVRIGHFNLFRGGHLIHIGAYAEILRTNVVNAIENPDTATPITPEFRLGAGSVITTGHWLDFTDAITIGCRSILGGRHSSIWTHNRQWTRPVSIGSFVYLGSEVRISPGATVSAFCVVGLGSVIIGTVGEAGTLVAGNPARVVKKLDDHGLELLTRKTRKDLPDDIGVHEMTLLGLEPFEYQTTA